MVGKCDLVDVAPDRALNAKVDAFVQVEMLEMSPGYAEVQKRALCESGLADESVETLLELKSTLREYREWTEKSAPKGGAPRRSGKRSR